MPNGDHDTSGFVGYGRIPSTQIKIDEKSETPALLRQLKWSILIIFGFLISIYVSINVLFGKDDLRYIVMGIYLTLSIGVFIWLRKFFEKRYDNYYLFREQGENGEWRYHLSTNTLRAFGLSVALFIGLYTQTLTFAVSVLHFPDIALDGAQIIDFGTRVSVIIQSVGRFLALAVTAAITLPVISIIIRLVFREMPDNYHGDTQTKQNWDKVQLDRERLHWEIERYNREHEVLELPSASPEENDVLVHPVMLSAPANPTAPMTDAQIKFRDAVFDFLDGLDEGRWNTSERSWRNEMGQPKILERSRFRLLKIGPEIRDKLIEKGWAEWKDTDHTLGWRLLFSTQEIREGAFNGTPEFRSAGRTGADASEDFFEDD